MKTKDKIMEATMDLFLENGIQGTSTKLLCEASGVSNGTLFHHFSSKEKIVEYTYKSIRDEMVANMKEITKGISDFKTYLWLSWKGHLDFAQENPHKYEFYNMFKNSSTTRNCRVNMESMDYFIYTEIEKAINNKVINVSTNEIFTLMFEANTSALLQYLRMYPDEDASKLIKIWFDKFWCLLIS
jgi:AcrR family transcriptional regulator